jgi:hypothetical protein
LGLKIIEVNPATDQGQRQQVVAREHATAFGGFDGNSRIPTIQHPVSSKFVYFARSCEVGDKVLKHAIAWTVYVDTSQWRPPNLARKDFGPQERGCEITCTGLRNCVVGSALIVRVPRLQPFKQIPIHIALREKQPQQDNRAPILREP